MTKFFLGGDISIFWETGSCLRIRKGVWNYTEAVLGIQHETENVKITYKQIADDLILHRSSDIDVWIHGNGVDGEAREHIITNFQTLVRQGFMHDSSQEHIEKTLINLLSFTFDGVNKIKYIQPAIFLGEGGCSNNVASFLSKETEYPLDIASQELLNDLGQTDLVTKSEAMEYLKEIEKFKKIFDPYSVILGCFLRPPVVLLRNLNRISVKLKKPLIIGFIDGPFLSIVSMASPETGCFECFENRVMARLEDVDAYKAFVKNAIQMNHGLVEDHKSFTPMISLLISVVLSEGFLTSSVRINKMSGRLINVYLPTLEIQVQDLLRVPYCPACGAIAAADVDELYTSGRVLIDRMLERIEIIETEKSIGEK